MIGPYSYLAALGFLICNVALPAYRGASGDAFLPILAIPLIWGFCFTMAYRKDLLASGQTFLGFVFFNAVLATPVALAAYGIGALIA